jgi:hypothetical protein
MSLIRAIALKDSRASGSLLASCGEGDPFELGPNLTSEGVYGGVHIVTYCSTQTFQGFIEAASSSGATYSTAVTFSAMACRDGEFLAPAASLDTGLTWFRAAWTMTTSADNGAGVVLWMSVDDL